METLVVLLKIIDLGLEFSDSSI